MTSIIHEIENLRINGAIDSSLTKALKFEKSLRDAGLLREQGYTGMTPAQSEFCLKS